MNLSALITSSLALLAFIVAFYALLARERKTPYITRSIYRLAGGVVVGVVLMLAAQAIHGWRLGIGLTFAGPAAQGPGAQPAPLSGAALYCALTGAGVFFLVIIGVLFNIWRLHNRDVHLLDQVKVKNLVPIRRARYFYRRQRRKAKYEYNPVPIDSAAVNVALKEAKLIVDDPARPISVVAICNVPFRDYEAPLIILAKSLMAKNWRMQYTTCSRHPYDFVHRLQAEIGPENWSRWAARLVVVDAYAPHFGFSDSVHWHQRDALTDANVELFPSAKSYAGIHTATTQAFNRLKERSGGEVRENTLMVYEGCSALVDLESPEQYRIFVRHVIPSERIWGGMLTLFVEPTVGPENQKLLDSYADLAINQLATSATRKEEAHAGDK